MGGKKGGGRGCASLLFCCRNMIIMIYLANEFEALNSQKQTNHEKNPKYKLMISRRKIIKAIGVSPALILAPQFSEAKAPIASSFSYCLNTSTIRGQNPGILKYIEIASEAGYDGIELWISDIKAFLEEGNSVSKLRKHLEDHHIKLENAIGFAPWMAEDEEKKKLGFAQMKEEMEILADLGSKRVRSDER